MKITRRQLRQIIKEEIGGELMGLMDRQDYPESERPDYPEYSESDPDNPLMSVSRSEFEADNKQELKLLLSYLRPVIVKVVDWMMTWIPDVSATKQIRDYAVNYMNKEMKEIVTEATYLAVMGVEGVSLEALLVNTKKLANSGPALNKLLREIQLALTSDAESGEPIMDKEAIKTAMDVFKANLGL